MKDCILDTNVLIWIFEHNEKMLTKKALDALFSVERQCYVSAVSLWEIQIKKHIGKLHIKATSEEMINTIKSYGYYLMAIPPTVMNTYQHLPLLHKDPFDRMIIAHALKNDYAVITADSHFRQYGVSVVWK